MRRIAKWCFTHRVVVLVAWVAVVAGANGFESAVGSAYTDNFKLPHTQSFDAVSLLQRNAPKASGDTDEIVIAVKTGRVTDPGPRARAQTVRSRSPTSPSTSRPTS